MPITLKFAIFSLMILLNTGCAHLEADKQTQANIEIEQVTDLLPGFSTTKYADLYFAGQPPLDQLATLKTKGFANIINLRQPKEGKYDASAEASAVTALGLNYTHIPIKGNEPLTDQTIEAITEAILANRTLGKTLVHCSSGNRVALWVGGHFFKDHGVPKALAIQIAEQAGLTSAKPKEMLENYLTK